MKTFILTVLVILAINVTAVAQSEKDSLKLKADIEAIRQGKPVKPTEKKSIMRLDDTLMNRVDTNALKPRPQSPTPPSPNNPNPHSPRPSAVNPSPPAIPSEDPPVPPGTPKGPDSVPKKKE